MHVDKTMPVNYQQFVSAVIEENMLNSNWIIVTWTQKYLYKLHSQFSIFENHYSTFLFRPWLFFQPLDICLLMNPHNSKCFPFQNCNCYYLLSQWLYLMFQLKLLLVVFQHFVLKEPMNRYPLISQSFILKMCLGMKHRRPNCVWH